MIHLGFLLSVLSFAAGIASIAVALLFHHQYRKRVIVYYALMLSAIALLTVSRALPLYAQVSGLSGLTLAALIFQKLGYILGVCVGPYFAHQLIGAPLDRKRRIIYTGIGTLYLVACIIEVSVGGTVAATIRIWAGTPALFGMYLYLVILGALYVGKLGSKTLNHALKVFFAASVVVFPFALYQYLTDRPFLPLFVETPLSFLVANIVTIVFSFIYFDQPAFLEGGSLSEHFRKRFGVTERESEIIGKVIVGMSNAEIAEKLFISQRTVESHLYAIFQKTGVRNRVQLANLIQTNTKG